MIEWSRTQADLIDMLNDCRAIFELAHQHTSNSEPLAFESHSTSDLFLEHANIDLPAVLAQVRDGNYLKLNEILKERGDLLPEQSNLIDAFFLIMIKKAIISFTWVLVQALILVFSACKGKKTEPLKALNKNTLAPKKWYNQGSTILHDFKPGGVYGATGEWKWTNNSDTMEIKQSSSSGGFVKWKMCS